MAKWLTCEMCGTKFLATHERKRVHCKECAEKLRREGRGPIQLQRQQNKQQERNERMSVVQTLDWSQAKERLLYYLNRFGRFSAYDSVNPEKVDVITEKDRELANKIAARMGEKVWAHLVGKSIGRIGQWDLLRMSGQEWQVRRKLIRPALAELLSHPGIGVARLTKALHRKRPKLIPICDSVLCTALQVSSNDKADRIIECMDKLRSVGQEKLHDLSDLVRLSKNNKTELTELRILELLYWVEFGPFPAILNEPRE